ncbi:MAG: fatty acid desaturase [Rhodococcus sp. (in: high G+C Gram-positive bacteria)]|uniref:fatty acid desaturase n=1 Tax=Rhodococcus sp. TaxID=1831 RepID=UPI002AD7DADB|nr:fatty acid desaturase [Rhodococcus sp. (in: high G+C Gram-positive bacteria)]
MTAVTPRSGTDTTGEPKDPISKRIFRLENPANVSPLVHVALWLGLPLAFGLFAPIAQRWYIALPLVLILTLLSFSLTIGVLHMHTHRPLFVSRRANRVVDILCSLPASLTAAEMREVHVLNHHRYNDGPGDVTSTEGRGARSGCCRILDSVRLHRQECTLSANSSPRECRTADASDVVSSCSIAAVALTFIVVCWYFAGTGPFVLFYWIPFLITQVNSGYFAWLTHAPARGFEDDPSKSLNTAGNWLNFFIFNQGYHSVHHRYPGVHWSVIPDKLVFMRDVEPEVIVPYWMTIQSAWRLAVPGAFLDAKYGERWKTKLENKIESGTVRPRVLRWFAWI